jgi:hypothetical protein
LREAVHSGKASGIVPSSFRIIRQLLSRLEDENTGAIIAEGFQADIPQQRIEQAEQAATVLGKEVINEVSTLQTARHCITMVINLVACGAVPVC